MTLAIAAGNREYLVSVSDRRLTALVGDTIQIVTEESTKSLIATFADARIVVTYTGFAQIERPPADHRHGPINYFRASSWIQEGLLKASQDGLLHPTLVEFVRVTEARYEELPVPNPHRPLTMSFTGYSDSASGPYPFAALISNTRPGTIESSASFRTEFIDTQRGSYVVPIGTTGPIRNSELDRIKELAVPEKPLRAVEGVILKTLRDAAARPAAENRIGKQCIVIAWRRIRRSRYSRFTRATRSRA